MMLNAPEFQGSISISVSVERGAHSPSRLALISWSFLSCWYVGEEVIKVTGITYLLSAAALTSNNRFPTTVGVSVVLCPEGSPGLQQPHGEGTHMCLSKCSVHCTSTMPSKGECSHTVPQTPSLPTTNYAGRRTSARYTGDKSHSD